MTEQQTAGVQILEDAAAMTAIFSRALQTGDGASLDIRSCKLDYVRYSPTRGIVQYTLGIANGDSGGMVWQIVTAATYGPERSEELWQHAVKADPVASRGIGPLALPAVRFVADLDLIIQTYPYDHRLPGLIRVVEGTPELVEVLFADAPEGNWVVESWDARVARYRPDMRAMAQVDLVARRLDDGKRVSRRTYAKVYRENEQGRLAYRLLQTLAAESRGGQGHFSVPRPIAYIEPLRTLLVSEAPGERLLLLVRRGRQPEVTDAVRRAARAVAGLHQVSLPDGLLAADGKDKHAQLDEVAARMAREHPEQAERVRQVAAAIHQASDAPLLAPTHFDLKLGHLLMADDQVTILDFDKMALGDPLIDVANLVASLDAERHRGQEQAERRAGLAKAFVDAYFADVPSSWRERFPAHFARAALIEAGTTGRGQRGRPGTRGRAGWLAAALDRAEAALQGDLW